MIDVNEVLKIHEILIERYGGTKGSRDRVLLEASLNRINQSFGGKDLYPTTLDKAAAIIESVIKNHPFIDGNKRVGYVLMRLVLMDSNLDIEASQNEKYEFVINIASGKLNYDEIKKWINSKLK